MSEPRCTCAESNATGATSWDYRCEACTDGDPMEMRHCDGCGEDYNAFEESHVAHGLRSLCDYPMCTAPIVNGVPICHHPQTCGEVVW